MYDPTARIAANEALKHPWFSKYIEVKEAVEVTTRALINMRTFKAEQKMQQAAITFIVRSLASHEEFYELEVAFKNLDTNMDGRLSFEELTNGYRKYVPGVKDEEINRIVEIVDADGSGEIDYWEFVVATIDKSKLLTEEKMKAAFTLFDKDGGGKYLKMLFYFKRISLSYNKKSKNLI